jgi:hypothetical protein
MCSSFVRRASASLARGRFKSGTESAHSPQLPDWASYLGLRFGGLKVRWVWGKSLATRLQAGDSPCWLWFYIEAVRNRSSLVCGFPIFLRPSNWFQRRRRGAPTVNSAEGSYRVPIPTLCTVWNNFPSVLMLGAMMISVS